MIDSDSELNAMILIYAATLGFKVYFITVKAQKIDSFWLKTFGMIIASFQVLDRLGRV